MKARKFLCDFYELLNTQFQSRPLCSSVNALQVQVIKTLTCAINFSTEIMLKLVHNKCIKLPKHDTIQIKVSDDDFIVKRGETVDKDM
jgi:hypothetical protein